MPFTSSSAIQEEMPRLELPSRKKMPGPRNLVEMGRQERRYRLVRLRNALGYEAVLKNRFVDPISTFLITATICCSGWLIFWRVHF